VAGYVDQKRASPEYLSILPYLWYISCISSKEVGAGRPRRGRRTGTVVDRTAGAGPRGVTAVVSSRTSPSSDGSERKLNEGTAFEDLSGCEGGGGGGGGGGG
jgi:hypothetical protein